MRITAQAKQATHARILEAARRLFREKGFDETTVRDIALEADVATGTLFNYFAFKEEIAVALAHQAALTAKTEFLRKRREGAALREDLFLHVATQLRLWRPLRKFFQPVVETALASWAHGYCSELIDRFRREELETVEEIARGHGIAADRWTTTVPIYWSLYFGVLTFWIGDKSPKQEDTLAMLDQATHMFVSWVESVK